MKAVISTCGRYRYSLERTVQMLGHGTAVFVMLNPSTADATQDDPTIRRCLGFARTWGCTRLVAVNLFALRATKPRELWSTQDPVGPDNDNHVRAAMSDARILVCAWGDSGKSLTPPRVRAVVRIYEESAPAARLMCLGTTKAGTPLHPLYLKSDTPLQPWRMPSVEVPRG